MTTAKPKRPTAAELEPLDPDAIEQEERARLKHEIAAASASDGDRRHRLRPDEVMELLPKRLGRLRLNIRTGDVLTETAVLSSNQIGRLYLQLSSRAESWPKEPTADAVALLASQDHFDPVAEYLNAIEAEPLPMEQWSGSINPCWALMTPSRPPSCRAIWCRQWPEFFGLAAASVKRLCWSVRNGAAKPPWAASCSAPLIGLRASESWAAMT